MELMTQATYSLTPNEVKIVERDDDDLGYLWFADRTKGEVRYIMLTRSYQDSSLHLERDDQKWASNNGLTGVEFDGTHLVMRLDKAAATALGSPQAVVLDCRSVSSEMRSRLQVSLASLLAGTNVPLHMAFA